ncbi:glycerate kinase [Capsulimonas corticalis]|uniref:Glycerate kinase n=1 Tax=Capsulimonas corticalis TaxID=2219043 RepID=A0A402D4L0_9BACT|nr:glycerate kinase [Capsulimonas corticalis]BDI29299.1 glycerate kinase [Capsulimonas corticalis]
MKIIIAPDSFKGTLTARQAALAMAAGVRQALPDAEIVLLPLADGGEGTTETLVTATDGELVTRTVTGPLGEPVQASFGLIGADRRTAVIEMAQAAGLGLVPADRRDPRVTTTYGVGELMRAATDAGAREILVGLGGSATNDGGAGAMQALGARFLDAQGRELPHGGAALARLESIDLSAFDFPKERITIRVASDVRNPLIGPDGASAVYGPQKGATPDMVAELDRALTQYAQVIQRDLGCDVADLPGAGAAGGLGAALAAFFGATSRSGIDVVMDTVNFEAKARGADWVLTGEGYLDRQTLSGKLIAGLLARCRKAGVPVIAFGGGVEESAAAALIAQGLTDAVSLVGGGVTREEALRDPARVLQETTARTMTKWA